jgi:hypothetical protein
MIVINRRTKIEHFIPMKSTYKGSNFAQVFLKEVVKIHDFLRVIVSNQKCFHEDFRLLRSRICAQR